MKSRKNRLQITIEQGTCRRSIAAKNIANSAGWYYHFGVFDMSLAST